MEENKIVKSITSGDDFLYQKAKQIYTNPFTYLREALQNAIDSGSGVFDVTINYFMIIIKDRGAGMSGDFLRKQFSEIGAKTKGDGSIGNFGEGRLSYYMPLVSKDSNENIVYNGHVEIVTADGKRKSKFVWNTLSTFDVIDEGPTTERGTTIFIIGKNGLGVDEKKAREYLSKIAVDIDRKIDITVNGVELENTYSLGGPVYVGADEFTNKTSGKRGRYDFRCYVNPDSNVITIAEKGLYVTETPAVVGGVINFTGSADGTNGGITTLSRESIVLDTDEVVFKFMTNAVTKKLLESRETDAIKKNTDIVNVAYWIATHAPKGYNAKSVVKSLINEIKYREGTIGELGKVHRIVYSSEDPGEALYNIAAKKGYFIAFLGYDDYTDSVRTKFGDLMNYLNIKQIQKMGSVRKAVERSAGGKEGLEEKLRKYISAMLEAARHEEVREQLGRKVFGKIGHGMKKAGAYTATGLVFVGTGLAVGVAGMAKLALLGGSKAYKKMREYESILQNSAHEKMNMIKIYRRFNKMKGNPSTNENAGRTSANENRQQKGGLGMIVSAFSEMVAAGKFAIALLQVNGVQLGEMNKDLKEGAKTKQQGSSAAQTEQLLGMNDGKGKNELDFRYYMMMQAIAEKELKKQIISEERQKIKKDIAEKKRIAAEQRSQRIRGMILSIPSNFKSMLYDWSMEQAVNAAAESIKKGIVKEVKKEVREKFRLEKIEEKRKIELEKAKAKEDRRMARKAQARSQYIEKSLNSGTMFSNLLGTLRERGLGNSEVVADVQGIRIVKAKLESDTVASYLHGTIVLNMSSPFVKEALEKGRVDLLLPAIAEQYLVGIGVNPRDIPAKALRIIENTNKRIAENEIVLHGSVKANSDGKPMIPEIKLDKEEIARLGSRNVEVFVTPENIAVYPFDTEENRNKSGAGQNRPQVKDDAAGKPELHDLVRGNSEAEYGTGVGNGGRTKRKV